MPTLPVEREEGGGVLPAKVGIERSQEMEEEVGEGRREEKEEGKRQRL